MDYFIPQAHTYSPDLANQKNKPKNQTATTTKNSEVTLDSYIQVLLGNFTLHITNKELIWT